MVQPTSQRRSAALDDLLVGLRDVVTRVRRHGSDTAGERAAVVLLAHLTELGPLRPGDLAERACLDASTVSRHLRWLEDRGYLERSPDPADRRATVVQVSAAGRRAVAAFRADRLTLLDAATRGWSPTDLDTLGRLLRRLADDLENR